MLAAHHNRNVSLAPIVVIVYTPLNHALCTLPSSSLSCLSPPSPAMSLFVLGIFELGSGRETQTLRPNSTQYTRHHVYDTTLQCEDPNAQLHVEIREFITGNITPRANGTLCFLISKAFVPPTSSSNNPVQPVLFESQALIPFPGDVNQPDYDDNIPLDTHAYVFASGTVCGAHFTNINGSVVFPMQVQEFIRGESKMCVIE